MKFEQAGQLVELEERPLKTQFQVKKTSLLRLWVYSQSQESESEEGRLRLKVNE